MNKSNIRQKDFLPFVCVSRSRYPPLPPESKQGGPESSGQIMYSLYWKTKGIVKQLKKNRNLFGFGFYVQIFLEIIIVTTKSYLGYYLTPQMASNGPRQQGNSYSHGNMPFSKHRLSGPMLSQSCDVRLLSPFLLFFLRPLIGPQVT